MSSVPPEPVLRVVPSILSADFGHLADAVATVEPTTDWLHIDVMDGHFVPNLSLGPPAVSSLRQSSGLHFDTHLMISEPARYLDAFAKAGSDGCTVHVEVGETDSLCAQMRHLGLRVGVALNPDTPFSAVQPYLGIVDMVLCMTVFPGFGGQSFIAEVMPKVRQVRQEVIDGGYAVDVEVDGGIDDTTVVEAAAAGANVFVAGSSVYGGSDPAAAVNRMLVAARAAVDARSKDRS